MLALADDLLDRLAHRLQADPATQRLGRHALTLVNEAKQQVLGAMWLWLSIWLLLEPGPSPAGPGR